MAQTKASHKKDLVGVMFGSLLVLSGRKSLFICKCSCGALRKYYRSELFKVVSCGCLKKEVGIRSRVFKHGQASRIKTGKVSIEYKTWQRIKDRCRKESIKNRKWYFDKGIKVCRRWLRFEYFFKDMGRRPSTKTSIDRIDNSKGYSPSNCRWASVLQQANNRGVRSATGRTGL